MRRLAAVVLLLSLVGCGSELKVPTAAPSASDSPDAQSTPLDPGLVSPSASPSASASPGTSGTPAAVVPGASAPASSAPVTANPGQRYSVTALVAKTSGHPDQLCAPAAAQPMTGDPTSCVFGLTTVGLDFSTLADRREKNGDVVGRAALTVTLDAKGVLHVVSQSVPPAYVPDSGFRTPPCAAPKGGWPQGKADEQLDLTPIEDYKRKHPGVILRDVQLRPSKTQVVAYVLVNGDPKQVDTDLRPSYGARFCAFKSTYTADQLNAADLDKAFRYGRARGVYLRDASALSLAGQLEEHVGALITTPDLEAAVKKTPAGLVRLELLLTPTS